jgi:ubiquitin-like protein Pup
MTGTVAVSIGKPSVLRVRVEPQCKEGLLMPTHEGGQTRPQRPTEDQVEESAESSADVAERHEKLSEDVDAILDEIDEVLESNAEDFVRAFVQKGGE